MLKRHLSHAALYYPLLLAIVLIFVFTLFAHSANSMWHDEAFTFVNFIDVSYLEIIVSSHSNNHQLFSLISRLFVQLFGDADIVIRGPSIIAVVGSAALLYGIVLRLHGSTVALMALTAYTVSPMVIYWSHQARGYGLILAISAGLQWIFVQILRDGITTKRSATFFVLSLLGFMTLHNFAIFAGILGAILLLSNRQMWKRFVAYGLVTFVLMLALLSLRWGSLAAPLSLVGSARNPGLDWIDIWYLPFERLIYGTIEGAGSIDLLVPGLHRSLIYGLALMFIAGTIYAATRRDMLSVSIALSIYAFLLVSSILGYRYTDRNFLFVLPWLILGFTRVVVAPAASLVKRFVGDLARGVRVAVALSLVFLSGYSLRAHVEESRIPIEAFAESSAIAAASNSVHVYLASSRPQGFARYIDSYTALGSADELDEVCRMNGTFALIIHQYRLGFDVPEICSEPPDASDVTFDQRRRGSIRILLFS